MKMMLRTLCHGITYIRRFSADVGRCSCGRVAVSHETLKAVRAERAVSH